MSRLRSLSIHYRTVYGALILGTVVTLVVLLVLQGLPFFTTTELSAYDYHFSHRQTFPVDNRIVVVSLDAQTLDDLAGPSQNIIPRRYMADAINYLHAAHARVIMLDFLYLTPTTARDDGALAAAIKRAGNVVLAQKVEFNATSTGAADVTSWSLSRPIERFARVAAGVGLANIPTDEDQKVRSGDLMLTGPGDKLYPSFAVQGISVALHKPPSAVVRGLPNQVLVNYLGPSDLVDATQQVYRVYSLESVAHGEPLPSEFRDKIVVVIPGAVRIKDIFSTPFGAMYGGMVQANVTRTVLNRNPITPVGSTANSLIILIMGLVTTIVASRFGIYRSAIGVVVIFAGYAFLNSLLFDYLRIWTNLISPETAVVLVFAAVMSLRFGTEERQRRRTSKIFGQYVKPEIVDILINAPDEEKALAGGRRPISVLFVDIRGFTRMSEAMEPEDVVKALDVYLEELTASVQKFDGTVDKYVGDELMAIWNAPSYQDDHALRAVLSGLDMLSRLDSINQQLRSQGLPAVRYGIGINSGDVIVGQMGSSFRKQYDVIGDTVNTAARLCSAAAGGEIIIGQETWEMIGDRLVVEETEPLVLKGKSRGFRTFRVIGVAPAGEPAARPLPAPA